MQHVSLPETRISIFFHVHRFWCWCINVVSELRLLPVFNVICNFVEWLARILYCCWVCLIQLVFWQGRKWFVWKKLSKHSTNMYKAECSFNKKKQNRPRDNRKKICSKCCPETFCSRSTTDLTQADLNTHTSTHTSTHTHTHTRLH